MFKGITLIFLSVLFCSAGIHAQTRSTKSGVNSSPPRVESHYYLDQREFNSLAVFVSTNRLPSGFSIWGFTEINATQNDPDNRWNLSRALSEYRLSHAGIGNILGLNGLWAINYSVSV